MFANGLVVVDEKYGLSVVDEEYGLSVSRYAG
jgi:hypothetical protein